MKSKVLLTQNDTISFELSIPSHFTMDYLTMNLKSDYRLLGDEIGIIALSFYLN